MLLYLTSNENLGLFDFLTEEKGMLVKKLSGEFSLNKFVVHDMRNLSHFSYIAIDLAAIKDGVDEIIEAITAFKTMYDSRIIIFAEKADSILLNRIIDETETYNIITAKSIEKIKEEIGISVSSQGMNKEYLMHAMNNSMDLDIDGFSKHSFIGENIKIVLAGAMHRVGTTTTAMNMACYLASIGAKVSYTEANDNNHLTKIHSYFFHNIPVIDDCFSYEGVDFFFNNNVPLGTNYNFNIIDIGVVTEKNSKVFNIGEVKILCSGIKPYETTETVNSLEFIDLDDEGLNVLLSEGEVLDIKKTLQINQDRIYSTKFSSNLFNNNINTRIWKLILSNYIVEHKTL